jgi:hypothetical protein
MLQVQLASPARLFRPHMTATLLFDSMVQLAPQGVQVAEALPQKQQQTNQQ